MTGASGYIGRHLITQLLEQDCLVHALVPPAERCDFDARVRVITGDICDPPSLREEIGCIYHCAGLIYDERRMWEVNVEGTRRMTELALSKGCRMIHLSSAGVIGRHPPGIIDEAASGCPGNIYEKSKHEAENVVKEAVRQGLQVQVLRPTIVFGGLDRIPERDSFLQLLRAMKAGMYLQIGHGTYNLIHVSEVARAMIMLNDNNLDNGGVFFINTPVAYEDLYHIIARMSGREGRVRRVPYPAAWSAAMILSLISRVTGKTAPLTFSRLEALTDRRIFSQQKLEQVTGYQPLVPVDKYIEIAFEEYRQKALI